ncbi:hypothetical protein LINPERHAP2_LOCUS32729, partial [Linum perenne]
PICSNLGPPPRCSTPTAAATLLHPNRRSFLHAPWCQAATLHPHRRCRRLQPHLQHPPLSEPTRSSLHVLYKPTVATAARPPRPAAAIALTSSTILLHFKCLRKRRKYSLKE